MRRATLYDTPNQRAAAACPNCGIPNGIHDPARAMDCWRAELRHPDADADDMLFLAAGGVAGIVASPTLGEAVQAAARMLEELQAAITDRLAAEEEQAEVEAEIVYDHDPGIDGAAYEEP